MNKNRTGFTLIEILMSLTLASIVFVVVSSLLVSVFSANTKSYRSEIIERTKNSLFVELSNSIRWAKSVDIEDGLAIDRIVEGGVVVEPGVVYQLDNATGMLKKNGNAITPKGLKVTRFELHKSTNIPAHPGIEIEISFESQNGINLGEFKIFSVNRDLEVEV